MYGDTTTATQRLNNEGMTKGKKALVAFAIVWSVFMLAMAYMTVQGIGELKAIQVDARTTLYRVNDNLTAQNCFLFNDYSDNEYINPLETDEFKACIN